MRVGAFEFLFVEGKTGVFGRAVWCVFGMKFRVLSRVSGLVPEREMSRVKIGSLEDFFFGFL